MGISNQDYFLLFLMSFTLVGILTPIMRKIAVAQNVIDLPNSPHKSHKKSVPYLGGIAIITGVVSTTYFASLISEFTRDTFLLATSVLVPAVILGIIGLFDDIKNLSPWPRFVAQTVAGIFTALLLISTDNFGNPTGSRFFDISITIIWIVGICNAINFFDNLDGGAAGTVAVSSLGLAILSIHSEQYLITAMSVVTLGSMLGFLIWNKSPARIYMGDAGALFLGILIAVLSIRLKPITSTHVGSYLTPVLLLAVPILDTSIAVLSRLRRNLSPFQGGRDHLSHRLIRIGIRRKTAAIILWTISAIFVALALAISLLDYSERILIIISGSFWLLLFVFFFFQKDE